MEVTEEINDEVLWILIKLGKLSYAIGIRRKPFEHTSAEKQSENLKVLLNLVFL